MTARPSAKRRAQSLETQLRELYRAVLREPIPAWLRASVDQLEANERSERAA